MLNVVLSSTFGGILSSIYEKIEAVFRRSPGRPLYLGEIANDIGWSLERTQRFIDEMRSIRSATSDEKRALDAPAGSAAVMYVLCGSVKG